jgi:hypothetical protein
MRIVIFAAAALLAGAAATPPAGAAVRIGLRLESATVLPGGTAADLRYVVVCPPGALARLGVTVAQRAGAHVAVGTGGTDLVCNGVPRTVLTRVAAAGGSLSFRPGRARVDADLRTTAGAGLRVTDDRARLVVLRR